LSITVPVYYISASFKLVVKSLMITKL